MTSQTQRSAGWNRFQLFALVALFLLFASRLHLLWVRLYDPDEFEHLHAGLSIARGQVPYRDFFEHHGPLAYYVAAPITRLVGPELFLLTANRLLSLVFVLLTAVGVFQLCVKIAGRRSGWLALLWLFTLCPFVEKSIEWRPDVPAMALVTWSAVLLVGATDRRRVLAAGFLFGLSYLCTQKVVFLMPGLVLGFRLQGSAGRQFRALIYFVLAAILPWIGFIFYAFSVDAGNQFLNATILDPLTWPSERVITDPVFSRMRWAPGHLAFFLAASLASVARLRSGVHRACGGAMPLLACVSQIGGLFVTPAAYLQYFMLMMPFAAVMVGVEIPCLWRSLHPKNWNARIGRLWLIAILVFSSLLIVGFQWQSGGLDRVIGAIQQWPRLFDASRPLNPWLTVDLISLGCGLLGALLLCASGRIAVPILVLALFLPSIGRIAIQEAYWPRSPQIEDLRFVQSLLSSEDRALDGFSGLACFQPHAFHWYWINPHSAPLLRREGKMDELLELVRKGSPALVIFDENLQKLGVPFEQALSLRYRPLERKPKSIRGVFLLRDDFFDENGQLRPRSN